MVENSSIKLTFVQTLLLASAIIRLLWSTAQSRAIMSSTQFHSDHVSQPLPQYFAMIGRRVGNSPDDGELTGEGELKFR
jgi:hypothetical protein